jgi:HD-like signal output (HDOD) protein
MFKETRQDILKKLEAGYSLPALSVVATKLIELASNETASVKDLADLIGKDPSLTVRLIRLSNAAFFRTSGPVTSVEQAVFRIGLNRLRIMALSLSLRDTFPMGRRGPMDYEQFWKISLYKALLSKSLALNLNNCGPDEAFTAGLVQEIGLLIFFDLFIKDRDKDINLFLYPLEALLSAELERYGVNHREVGEAALGYWQFPETIIACQSFHPRDKKDKIPPLVMNCEIAGIISSMIFQKSFELNDVFKRIEELYGVDHEIISDIMISTFNEVEVIANSFRVEVNKDKDLLEIMEKANRALACLTEQISACQSISPECKMPSFKSLEGTKDRDTIHHTLQAVAHEIRNPLASVGGFVKKLSKTMDSSSESWGYMQIIIEETKKMEQALSRMTGSA